MTPTDTKVVSPTAQCASVQDSKGPAWNAVIAKYKVPSAVKSCWQVVNTFLPLAALWYLMYLSSTVSTAFTLLLAVPTAGFLVRVFIIQHDCGHHSFFRRRRANDILGVICGVLTLTPYHMWRRTHSRHHTTSGNLDHRGQGDVLTLTVNEYVDRSRWGRWQYRVYRNPLVMFTFGASYLFMIRQRFTFGIPRTWRRERASVHFTNLCLLSILIVAQTTIGLPMFVLLWLPVAFLGAAAGCWLFFVQHQFEHTYWQPRESWDYSDAALEGSSFYRLPWILQWITGSIGYHHIHHLNSRIPNYNLAACHDAEPEFRRCTTFGIWESLRCPSLKLWDEKQQRMVGFAAVGATGN